MTKLIQRGSSLLSPLLSLIPNRCFLCDTSSATFLCEGCNADLPRSCSSCYACALPLAHCAEMRAADQASLCGDCLRHPKPFERTIAAFDYGHPVDFLVNRLKHHRHFASGDFLAEQLALKIAAAYQGQPLPELLMAVPLHWTRHWTRGFNQSELIGGVLRKRLTLPALVNCRRHRRNPRQQGLKRTDRLRNLHGVFSVEGNLAGRHIALVDDVMTTGATVTALAHTLKETGAARIDVWVVARVP